MIQFATVPWFAPDYLFHTKTLKVTNGQFVRLVFSRFFDLHGKIGTIKGTLMQT